MRILITILLTANLLVCAQAPAQMAPMTVQVKVAPVIQDTVNVEITALGTLRSEEAIIVRPEVAGRVQTIHFQESQLVNKNDPLISLDAAEYKAQLESSAAQLRMEELNFERTRMLFSRQLTSRQNLDEAQAKLDAARAWQEKDQVRLDKMVIRAPFTGVVGLRQVSPGAYVSPGQDLTTFGSMGSIKLDFQVPEVYLPRIKTGQPVSVRVDAYPDRLFKGNVYAIDPRVDEATRTVQVRARLPNPDSLLRPGMFGRIALTLERRDKALLVPEQAIVPQGQRTFVFRVVDGKVAFTAVTLGQRRPGQVEVTAGLNPDDRVVTDGQIKLRDGAPVQVLPAEPAGQDK